MSNVAIRCEGLSKRYRIGGYTNHYKVLRDVISDAAAAPFRRLKNAARNGNGFRWALFGKAESPVVPLLISVIVVLMLLTGGLYYFRRLEQQFADIV